LVTAARGARDVPTVPAMRRCASVRKAMLPKPQGGHCTGLHVKGRSYFTPKCSRLPQRVRGNWEHVLWLLVTETNSFEENVFEMIRN
ncbi:hypothetical protein AVEN_188950-1, partial [Araneus ventricosus]